VTADEWNRAAPLEFRGKEGGGVFAYIDAGTGSLLVQAIAGGVAATIVFAKVYWRRLRRFLHIGMSDDEAVSN
jgi:hypothetical protein